MGKKTIMLVSTDNEYVTNVEGTLSRSIKETYRLEFITEIEYLNQYLQTAHKIDVLIVEEMLLPRFSINQSISKTLIITDTDKMGASYINKYLGAQGIIKLLGPEYMSSEAGGEQPKTRIHDVVALEQPAFKTVAAITLASQLAVFGKKVLYLCAENMQCFNSVLSNGEKLAVSQESQALAINAVISGDDRGLDTLIQKGKFDYMPQFSRFLSAYGITSDMIFALAESIGKLEIYDEIVVEHPYGFAPNSISRLERSSSIVIASGQDKNSIEKLNILFENTRGVADNCVIVCYPFESAAPDYLDEQYGDNGIICERIRTLKGIGTLNELVENRVFRSTAEAVL